jgi:hypothetical protein
MNGAMKGRRDNNELHQLFVIMSDLDAAFDHILLFILIHAYVLLLVII